MKIEDVTADAQAMGYIGAAISGIVGYIYLASPTHDIRGTNRFDDTLTGLIGCLGCVILGYIGGVILALLIKLLTDNQRPIRSIPSKYGFETKEERNRKQLEKEKPERERSETTVRNQVHEFRWVEEVLDDWAATNLGRPEKSFFGQRPKYIINGPTVETYKDRIFGQLSCLRWNVERTETQISVVIVYILFDSTGKAKELAGRWRENYQGGCDHGFYTRFEPTQNGLIKHLNYYYCGDYHLD